MRVAHIGFYHDPADRPPEMLLEAWPTLVDVAESVAAAGARVSVIQSSGHSRHIHKNGIDYHFLPLAGSRRQPSPGEALRDLLRTLDPQVLHVHGLGFPGQVLLMAKAAPGIPVLLQDHANRLPRWWRQGAFRRCARVIAGVAFCSRQQAQPFIAAGIIGPDTAVYEIPESTSRFQPGSAAMARGEARVWGQPLLLWVGHLDANKDPLTVLEGVAQAIHTLPRLQLWCCFGKTKLLGRLRRRIRSDPQLECRTHLLGQVSHAQVEQLMHAADAFVSGSHHEGSGYALIEALACGLPPVVTDIPSFRALTGGGAVGRLWTPGDPASLCSALLELTAPTDSYTRGAVRAHFERELSSGAVGHKLVAAYEDLLARPAPAPPAASVDAVIDRPRARVSG
ncbi:MAG TPA: glycosyltransferase [Steroidobacteraceae bacterium]|jgi:glycosyltransferase involved in cell wall biosynthesis|nr:glycosyltransferase [Steroidobacteraceae bacterium]